jgi:addiction module HigA family antidote
LKRELIMAHEYPVKLTPKMSPVHPGELLREEVFPAMRMSVAAAARGMHISRQMLHGILAEKRVITPEMALRLGKFIGNGPGLWLRMQQDYDMWQAQVLLAKELVRIPTVRAGGGERQPAARWGASEIQPRAGESRSGFLPRAALQAARQQSRPAARTATRVTASIPRDSRLAAKKVERSREVRAGGGGRQPKDRWGASEIQPRTGASGSRSRGKSSPRGSRKRST